MLRTSVLALAVTFPTHDNGTLVGATRGRGYFCYFAEPGAHAIRIDADEAEVATLQAQAGKAYFLHEEVDNYFGYVKCRAVWLRADAARAMLQGIDDFELVGVPGDERLPETGSVVKAAVAKE